MDANKTQQAVFTTLAESTKGLTLREIADRLGMNYFTCRPYVQKLLKEELIEEQAVRRGREIVYQERRVPGMPIFQDKQGVPNPVANWYSEFAKKPMILLGVATVAHNFPRTLASVFEKAYEAYIGTLTQKEMMEFRNNLVQHRAEINVLLKNYDSLLNHPKMWQSPQAFGKAIYEDPDIKFTPEDHTANMIKVQSRPFYKKLMESYRGDD